MRTIKIYSWIVTLLAGMGLFSCTEDQMELNKGYDELSVSASADTLVLDVKAPDAKAITIEWTSGSNMGTGAAIEYTFRMDLEGNAFQGGIVEYMGKGVYSLSYTNEQLTMLMLEELALPIYEDATIEVSVVAEVLNETVETQVSDPIKIVVTPYRPVSKALYLIGDATPNGWDAGAATKMTAISGEAGGFVWTGELRNPGSFKFITSLGEFLPSYNKDMSGTSETLYLRESDDDPDEQFSVPESAFYRITVNIIDLTYTIEETDGMAGPKYENIYFVGSFTGWSHVAMKQDGINPFIFRFGDVMEWTGGGEFKFGTALGSWDDMYHPTISNAPYTHSEVMQNGEGDHKWLLSEAESNKPYKLYLDITEGEEKMMMSAFTPFENMYLVGSASPNGWDLGNATPMTIDSENPYIFRWTGAFAAGELKFSCDKQSDWNGAWFMPVEADRVPTGDLEDMLFTDKSSPEYADYMDVDMKWNIQSAGTYTITLDQLKETVSIVKQ
jgi:hypothetical protein